MTKASGEPASTEECAVAVAVREGLAKQPKQLPPWLFYDARGSELFEAITTLPEYYLTRAERSIFERDGDAMVATAAAGHEGRLHVVELGAGTADKTQVIVRAVVRHQGHTLFLPIDVSPQPLAQLVERFTVEEPKVEVRALAAHHDEAFPVIKALGPRRMVLFVGSSIGNYDPSEAVRLLRGVAETVSPGGVLLLGADRRKDPARLVAAYDDAAGVTAAFNLNLLTRLNRELKANFVLSQFRHEALWNEAHSRMEMHLVSLIDQRVDIEALGTHYDFGAGESLHTESSYKYDQARIDAILEPAGFHREITYTDDEGLFDVHLARR